MRYTNPKILNTSYDPKLAEEGYHECQDCGCAFVPHPWPRDYIYCGRCLFDLDVREEVERFMELDDVNKEEIIYHLVKNLGHSAYEKFSELIDKEEQVLPKVESANKNIFSEAFQVVSVQEELIENRKQLDELNQQLEHDQKYFNETGKSRISTDEYQELNRRMKQLEKEYHSAIHQEVSRLIKLEGVYDPRDDWYQTGLYAGAYQFRPLDGLKDYKYIEAENVYEAWDNLIHELNLSEA
ncbi:hypothetical protein [Thermoactinomyces sp. DSM 45892]|uniref:hypothetical protein n=1 Tax=Thermoactinomyces sp. DSM 45892 TaxID=1882753 RepID=UPI0011604FD3|nr:hypothetical protein [Thermoactinomyces sp. DSM 45892]